MLRDADAARIEAMRRQTGAASKVAVVRQALDLLEASLERAARAERWRRAVARVAQESARVNRELVRAHPAVDTPASRKKPKR